MPAFLPNRALSEARPSPGQLLSLAFNILLITGVAVLCISGYDFAMGLSIVVLALMPALLLLNIALFAWMEEERRASPLRVVSTSTQASQHNETLDKQNPSIVPETSEPANTQASHHRLKRPSLRLGPEARREIAKWMKVAGT